jgi:hypothetical protein
MTSIERLDERWMPQTEADRAQVMEQLERLLAHPSFQNSKRYPKLLRFVVEQCLAGNEEQLKERWLGTEVFQRAADYDTNQDPVVRLSAGEVRKRLALYYQLPEHQNEMVIGLHPGSYVPCFSPPRAGEASVVEVEDEAEEAAASGRKRRAFLWACVGAAFAVALLLCWRIVEQEDPARKFWAPMLESPNRVTLCAGSPGSALLTQRIQAEQAASQSLQAAANGPNLPIPQGFSQAVSRLGLLTLSHASVLVHVGAFLESNHKPFRVHLDSEATFPELREGPVVLIGAGDNAWTMRLSAPLRYGFAYGATDQVRSIVDRRNPAASNWTVSITPEHQAVGRDYALIARYHDAVLDQPVVILAGLTSVGTEAASEFLLKPEALRALLHDAPRAADSVNLEAIVETQVIDGHAGPARVVAVEYW